MKRILILACACAITSPAGALAGDYAGFDHGRLLATGGVSQIDGAGGGGLAPWALITGYGSRDGVGVNAHYTHVLLPDYGVQSAGFAVGAFDRVELSYARVWFDTKDVGAALGLGQGFTFHQDVYGAKVRLIGDAVYEQDSWLPQISVGANYKKNADSAVLSAIGARRDGDIEFYAAATKLFLAESVLINGAVRMTRANQFGILGYGGDRNDKFRPQFEGSAALLLNRKTAVGVEYKMKPDNLSIAKEDDAYDVFLAYFLNKRISATVAYADLGSIVGKDHQRGAYFSLQVGF